MLKNANVPLKSAWNTWSERPGEMVFLPLGVRVTPVLFSTRARKATTIRLPDEVRLGRHGLYGEAVEFETAHGGTRLGFSYEKSDPFCWAGGWSIREKQEWGLRYWVVLCLSAESGAEVRYAEEDGAATVSIGPRVAALVSREAPVQVTGHDSIDALVADMDAKGYFDVSSRAKSAKVIALRFNLEMAPQARFAAAVADSRSLAVEKARSVLDGEAPTLVAPLHTGRNAGALDAVRDVIGWNTLYDRLNTRAYTAISRIWNIGDFAVWFNDQTFAALMCGLFDPSLARENFAVAMANATPQGNFACLLTSRDSWVDRSQAPHGAFIAWLMYLRSRDRSLLDLAYEPLARNHQWWRANRDPDGRGLVSCGTSNVGDALYKGTAFGARNETGMDNSATHDEAVYDPATRTLSTLDVGLNCALALDAEMLARIARQLDRPDDAASFEALAAETREKIRGELWDEARGLFANRQRGGAFVSSVGPTSFYPLLCGAASKSQASRLLERLADPAMFGGTFVLPNASRSEPAYKDNVYWRGRVWPNVNYLVWQGLRRYGFEEEAAELARKSLAMFEQSWTTSRLCGENYNAETGEITDQGDADPFYTWGAMLPLLGVSQIMDFAPWRGWEIANTGESVRLGPLASPAGDVLVVVEHGVLTLSNASGTLFSTDAKGRISHMILERGLLSLQLPKSLIGNVTFRLGPGMSARFIAARLDGREAPSTLEEGCRILDLTGSGAGARLDCLLSPPP
jgi:putative isomerase